MRIEANTVHTARLSYDGAGRYDCTRRGRSPFGPSPTLLGAYLKLRKRSVHYAFLAWENYRPRYVEEMRALWTSNRAAWVDLVQRAREGVVLCCFCENATHCHRRLLAPLVIAAGARLGVTLVQGEELGDGR